MAGRERKMAKVTLHPLAKPDDPIYNRPIMIGGRVMVGKACAENLTKYDPIHLSIAKAVSVKKMTGPDKNR